MKKENNNNLIKITLGISVLAMLMSGYAISQQTAERWDTLAEGFQKRQEEKADFGVAEKLVILDTDHVDGDKNADITIYEYSDFECPYCKRFSVIPAEIVKESGGKVNTVYRHFDGLHAPLSTVEANAAECAAEQGGDKAFFTYHDEVYKKTSSNGRSLTIKGKTGRGLDLSELPKIAESMNLDMAKFNSCVATDKYAEKIKSDTQSGLDVGIDGTPGVIIKNNKTGEIIRGRGAEPKEAIKAYIDQLLK